MIDDKLKEIIQQSVYMTKGGMVFSDDAIAQIKQVFADEGYIKEIDVSTPAITNYDRPKLLTGADWYERFEIEYAKILDFGQTKSGRAIKAARKASGL